jgi:transcriptional regulator with XRE-family HTH domain
MGRSITRGDMARQLGCSLQFLALIETHARSLAPNHPLVPKMAEILGLTLPEIQVFCKHEPYTESQIKLAKFRLGLKEQKDGRFGRPKEPKALLGSGNGSGNESGNGSGDVASALAADIDEDHHVNKSGAIVPSKQRRRTHLAPMSDRVPSLKARRLELGLNYTTLAAHLGCEQAWVYRSLDNPKALSPNHPLIPKIAKLLRIPETEVRRHAKRARMSDAAINMALARLGQSRGIRGHDKHPAKAPKPVTGKSTALVPLGHSAALIKARGEKNGKRAYNALRLMDAETRQCARSLAMATTLAAMKGQRYLDVAIPTEGMAAILNDWFRLKGIQEPVVVAVDYDAVFG